MTSKHNVRASGHIAAGELLPALFQALASDELYARDVEWSGYQITTPRGAIKTVDGLRGIATGTLVARVDGSFDIIAP